MTSIVREGYQIELLSCPPLSTDPIPMPCPRNSHKAQALRSEIRSLVDKRAVEEIFSPRLSPGFYSHIFLVPMKDGGCRPVFNLKPLNRYVAREKFKMKTPRDITTALHAGDWAVRIDLTDAYFHVPIHLKSRHLLRFALQMEERVRVFQFRALPFGLTSAPRVFTRVILPVAKFAHLHGLHLIQYLDDWILKHQDRASLIHEIAWLKAVIYKVGLVVNEEKSQFVPTQRFVHIGVEYHLDVGLIFPPPMDRILKIESSIQQLQTVRVTTARFWLSLLGLLNSAVDAIPLGRLHLRPLQIYLLAHWAPTSKDLKALIPVKLDLLHNHLAWWQNRAFTRAGMFLDLPDPQTHLFTDASTTGWGAHLETEYTMGTTDVGQCHGCGVSAQSRGDEIHSVISRQQRDSPLSSPPAYGPTSQTHSRREECISRPAISQGQSHSHRMDTQAVSSGCHLWGMGKTQPRSLCYPAEQQTSGLGFSHDRPSSSGSGCSVDVMEGDVRLRFPSICDIGESAREGTQRSPTERIDTGSPQMAQLVLVCQTVGSASRLSFAPAAEGRPPVSASQQTETSVPTSGVSTRLEAVQRSLQERGFSQAASAQISKGRRQSSRVVYDSKWRLFSRWCEEQEVNPFEVTVPQLADFFVYLFNVKQLNPRTIKGYRSAISATVSAYGSRREFSDSPELSALLRSFMLERPPQRKVLPQWSLPLILQVLLKPPFEPLQKSDLKYLTLKTVFLTALASGRRRSELHALCFDSAHFRQNQDQSLVTLYPDIDFVAKSQVLDSVAAPIKLQAFTSVGGRTRIGNSVR